MTVEVLKVDPATFDDIKRRLEATGTTNWQMLGGEISMDGLAIEADPGLPAGLIDLEGTRVAILAMMEHLRELTAQKATRPVHELAHEGMMIGAQALCQLGILLEKVSAHNMEILDHVR